MKEIICAGFGGQGVLTTGLILCDIAVQNGHNATWLPSYGSQMRGGTANCTVKYGEEFVYNTSMEEADVLLAMNQLSYNTFTPQSKQNAIVFVSDIVDTSTVELGNRQLVVVPCYAIAEEIGHHKGPNIVVTGAMLNILGDFTLEQGLDAMNTMFAKKGKAKFEALNTAAMRRGFESVNP